MNQLKCHPMAREILFLFLFSSFCFGLSVFRVLFSGLSMYLFLNWNLFLAFIPWLISLLLVAYVPKNKIVVITGVSLCILFFPNALYIVTDLFHLTHRAPVPLWFDLVLILSFAWTGLLYGFSCLRHLEIILCRYLKPLMGRVFSVTLLFAGSFGVYLGRYLRWNSWDIWQQPGALMLDVAHRLLYPFEHPGTWGMTLLLGLLFNVMYFSMCSGYARRSAVE